MDEGGRSGTSAAPPPTSLAGLDSAGWRTGPADRVTVFAYGLVMLGSTLTVIGPFAIAAAVVVVASLRGRAGSLRYHVGHLVSWAGNVAGVYLMILPLSDVSALDAQWFGYVAAGMALCAGGVAGCRAVWGRPRGTWWMAVMPALTVVFGAVVNVLDAG